MGQRSLRPVAQISWVERSPAKCGVGFCYHARAKLRSCAWRRQGKEPVGIQALIAQPSVERFDQRVCRLACPARLKSSVTW
jgi:hypothetical protein